MRLIKTAKKRMAFFLVFVLVAAMLPPAYADGPDQADQDVYSIAERLSRETESEGTDYDGYIFKVKDSMSRSKLSDKAYTVGEDTGIERIANAKDYYTAESLEQIKAFADEDQIEFIEPDYIITLDDDVETQGMAGAGGEAYNDEHLGLMSVPSAWGYGFTGADLDAGYDMGGDGNYDDRVVIAVIDSGLALKHEDIDYSRVLNGKNFVSQSSSNTTDTLGHGTFVTGQIIAVRGNGVGIAGIAQDAYVMPLKVFASRETATSIIISAIQYAAGQKKAFDSSKGREGENICVINMSLGGTEPSESMKEAVDAAISAGIIVIVAAGNDGNTWTSYPAQYAIGVGSTNSQGVYSYYSQVLSRSNGEGYENKVWVSAPGEDYTSTWYNGGYYFGSGTSFSAPEVSALAAIAVSIKNDLTQYGNGTNNHDAFRQLLKDTANPKSGGNEIDGQDCYYGWGIISFSNLIEKLTSLAENEGQPSEVRFSVDNGAGTPLTTEDNNLSITVTQQEDGAVQTATDGVYTLKIGAKYKYTVTADKFKTVSGSFIPIKSDRVIALSMEGKDYFVSFDVKNAAGQKIENAAINVFKSEGAKISAGDDGRFAVKNGTYRYIISAENFYPLNGSFVIDDGKSDYKDDSLILEAALNDAQNVCSVAFDVKGADAMMDPGEEVFVRDGRGETVFPQSDGTWKLVPGTYSYLIESDYYKSVSGSLTIGEEEKGTEKVISETMTQGLYWAFIEVTPSSVMSKDSTSITVTDSGGQKVSPFNQAQGEYRIVNGAYTYEVRAEGYKTAKGSFDMNGSTLNIDVGLQEGTDPSNTPDPSGTSGGGGGGGGGAVPTAPAQNPAPVQAHDTSQDSVAVYTDVPASAWYFDAVRFVASKGLFEGVSAAEFRPGEPMTRAMLATVLYRLDGKPKTETFSGFSDVPDGQWYSETVNWAGKTELITGYGDGRFGINDSLTRQQLAVILYRYAGVKEYDVTARVDLTAYMDREKISAYASDAMSWAVAEGLITGVTNTTLNPEGNASRAQIAEILQRFVEKIIDTES